MIFEARVLFKRSIAGQLRIQAKNKSNDFSRAFSLLFCMAFYIVILLCFIKTGYSQEFGSARECLYISEIMYNPTGDDSLLEFVELCNKCNSSVSLAGVTLEGVSYAFPNASHARPMASVIVPKSCFSEGDFCSQNPILIDNTFCCFSGTLTNTFKTISLAYDLIVFDSFSYTANSKENYSAQRFSNKTEFSLPSGSPGICYFSEEFLENITNGSIDDGNGDCIGDGDVDADENVSEDGAGVVNGSDSEEDFENSTGSYTGNLSNQEDICNATNQTETDDLSNFTNVSNVTNSTDVIDTDDLIDINNFTDDSDFGNVSNVSNVSNTSNGDDLDNATNESQTDGNASQASMNQTSMNQTNISQTNINQTIPNESCFLANISIDAPLLINESSTSYTISKEAPSECNYYYHYEVLDLCGNVIRELRESTAFGRKSFTPTSDCCAYQINAYLFESDSEILVANSTKYMIKPSSCEKPRDTTGEARLFESGGNVNLGFNVIEPLSADEQIEKVSFTLKAQREDLKSLQTFLKGSINVTSDYSKLVLGLDEDIFCKVDKRIYSLELSGKINSESFSEEIDIDCSDYVNDSDDDFDDDADDTISETPSNSIPDSKSYNVSSELGVVGGILRSLVDIKSFYTLKKNFSENISLYFNVDYNQSLLGELYGYIFEEPFEISPGKNEVVFPFKKGEGKLYLLIFNQTNAFGLRELNYSFNGFEDDSKNSDDSLENFENESEKGDGSNTGISNEDGTRNYKDDYSSFLGLSNLLSGNGSVLSGSELVKAHLTPDAKASIDWETGSNKKVSLVTGSVVSNKRLKPNDILLSILGIGTFSGLSYGLYRFSKK